MHVRSPGARKPELGGTREFTLRSGVILPQPKPVQLDGTKVKGKRTGRKWVGSASVGIFEIRRGRRPYLLLSAGQGVVTAEHYQQVVEHENKTGWSMKWYTHDVPLHMRWRAEKLFNMHFTLNQHFFESVAADYGDPKRGGIALFSRFMPRLLMGSIRTIDPVRPHYQIWLGL